MKNFAGRSNQHERLNFNDDGKTFTEPGPTKPPRVQNNGFALLPRHERSKVEYRPCVKYVGKAAIRRAGK